MTRSLSSSFWIIGCLALLILIIGSLSFGAFSFSLSEIWGGIWRKTEYEVVSTILWEMRLPRTLLAALVGAALSVAGVLSQTLVRNPLADPYLLGIANGASLFAVSGITLGILLPQWLLALLGATAAFFLVSLAARQNGLKLSPLALILCGVTISAIGASLTTLMMLLGDERALSQILRWLMGSLVGSQWHAIWPLLFSLILLLPLLIIHAHKIDQLLLCDDKAQSIGLSLSSERQVVALVILIFTAFSVAAAGVIGFLGLLVPHLMRQWFSASHRELIPTAALFGAITCVTVDLLCRVLFSPIELPISIPMALLTAPILLIQIRRQSNAMY
ncbi:FecCD family ABC transporter permease [Vibrio harveyi]